MPGRSSNNSRPPKSGKAEHKQLFNSLKGACPEHRVKDLEQLVADLKGDEERIQQQLDIWWSEPVKPTEEEWADVNRTKVAPPPAPAGRGGRGRGRGGGREGPTASAGRGGRTNEGRGGRAGRGRSSGREPAAAANTAATNETPFAAEAAPVHTESVPVALPKSKEGATGAWGKPKPKAPEKQPPVAAPVPPPVAITPPAPPKAEPIAVAVGGPPGNVWATKGSAHLIRSVQEKPKAPKPAPKAPEPDLASLEAATASLQIEPVIAAPPAVSEPPMPASFPVPPNAWTQNAPEPPAPPSPVRAAAPPVAQPKQQRQKERTNVLNMGHWDTANDDDDDNNLDFGFGSFVDSDVPSSAPSKMTAETATSGPSPARPPPGLSIGGMPPMPANAMLAHELENKLEEASLNAAAAAAAATAAEVHHQPTEGMDVHGAGSAVPGSVPPNVFHTQTGYSPYPAPGMGGMYDYNAGNAFVQEGGAPGLGPPKSQPLPPSGLYGAQPAPSSGNSSTAAANSNGNAGPGPLQPPGMHNMYGNPAMYYNQHHQAAFHMNQAAAGGLGYNYGYGAQFGGAAGFGYPQAMGQSASGYPLYDENAGGSYPKSGGGGYRGRNNNQYGQGQNQQPSLPNQQQQQQQQQYNPQGYQPYSMGYPPGDHFARGGYGGMQDPYAMQQQQHGGYGGGFNPNNNGEGNDQQRGKKGGNRGFSGHHPTQQFGQPLGGASTQPPPNNNSGGAWPNNQAWGGGSGAPSWQGAK